MEYKTTPTHPADIDEILKTFSSIIEQRCQCDIEDDYLRSTYSALSTLMGTLDSAGKVISHNGPEREPALTAIRICAAHAHHIYMLRFDEINRRFESLLKQIDRARAVIAVDKPEPIFVASSRKPKPKHTS